MTHRSSLCALLLLALTLPWAGPTLATASLFDNLGQDGDNATGITNDQWAAQGFTTTADADMVTEVEAALFSEAPTSGTFAMEIWNMASGAPGTKVADVFSGDASLLVSSTFAETGLSLTLSPLTDYFLVVKGISLDALSNVQWRYADAAGGTGLPSPFVQTTDAGASWSTPSQETPQKMRIAAATDVPVPPVPALLAIGLAGLRLTRRGSRSPAGAASL